MLPFRTARIFGIPAPAARTVDVWTIALDRPAAAVAALESTLDAHEQSRARRLWEGPLRSRFIVAHGAARQILAQYLGTTAAAVQFDRVPSGKPSVRGGAVSFNLSHSGSVAILAVACGGCVGADVELVRPVSDADRIVAQTFTDGEARQYAAFAPRERVAAWFSGWTRKEAIRKASGAASLHGLDVDLTPQASSVSVAGEAGSWFARSFVPVPGFTAAIAADFPIDVLNRLEWVCATEFPDIRVPLQSSPALTLTV
jgi:4'-phosphopantetheinyl transferase